MRNLLLLAVSLLVACGSGDDDSTPPPTGKVKHVPGGDAGGSANAAGAAGAATTTTFLSIDPCSGLDNPKTLKRVRLLSDGTILESDPLTRYAPVSGSACTYTASTPYAVDAAIDQQWDVDAQGRLFAIDKQNELHVLASDGTEVASCALSAPKMPLYRLLVVAPDASRFWIFPTRSAEDVPTGGTEPTSAYAGTFDGANCGALQLFSVPDFAWPDAIDAVLHDDVVVMISRTGGFLVKADGSSVQLFATKSDTDYSQSVLEAAQSLWVSDTIDVSDFSRLLRFDFQDPLAKRVVQVPERLLPGATTSTYVDFLMGKPDGTWMAALEGDEGVVTPSWYVLHGY